MLRPNNPAHGNFDAVPLELLPRAICGMIAILGGPILFSAGNGSKYLTFNRILGRVYIGSVLIAAPIEVMIAVVEARDHFFTTGVAVHASLWFITTLLAYLTIRNGNVVYHRQWMIRSYILTLSFIIERILTPLWGALHITLRQYGVAAAILSLTYLLVADIVINWREITSKRV